MTPDPIECCYNYKPSVSTLTMSLNVSIPTEIASTQYRIVIKPYLRQFVGNTAGRSLGMWTFEFESANEVVCTVWEKVHPYLARGISMTADENGGTTFSWMNGFPSVEQIDIFASILDVQSKRHILWSQINGIKLQFMSNRELKLYIYKYYILINLTAKRISTWPRGV